jgi:hypothetical protein
MKGHIKKTDLIKYRAPPHWVRPKQAAKHPQRRAVRGIIGYPVGVRSVKAVVGNPGQCAIGISQIR